MLFSDYMRSSIFMIVFFSKLVNSLVLLTKKALIEIIINQIKPIVTYYFKLLYAVKLCSDKINAYLREGI